VIDLQSHSTVSDGQLEPADVVRAAAAAGVPALELGRTGGTELILPEAAPISLARLRKVHEGWLPGYMRTPA